MKRSGQRRRYDETMAAVVLILVLAGLVLLYSTSAYNGRIKFLDEWYYLKKQGFATLIGLAGMLIVSRIDYHRWAVLALPGYLAAIALSVAVMLFGDEYNGSKRWLSLGPLSFQPSEFSKVAVIIFLAWLISRYPGRPDRFDRIFGIETEYGVSVTGDDAPDDAGLVAMEMFAPVVSRTRSTNTYLGNGSRLYLDVGSHPEYATAEARDPMDALAQDLAGEAVMRRLALEAQERLRRSHGDGLTVHVYKNNADSAGHSFGCHENYLVRRYVPLTMIERQLLPFLITRQIFTGAGRVTAGGFQVTQRADFLDEAVSSATTRARPMVNTRDEPHADPDSYRRLHVIIGDSNRSQFATWMKMATTHLVLCVMESAVLPDPVKNIMKHPWRNAAVKCKREMP